MSYNAHQNLHVSINFHLETKPFSITNPGSFFDALKLEKYLNTSNLGKNYPNKKSI